RGVHRVRVQRAGELTSSVHGVLLTDKGVEPRAKTGGIFSRELGDNPLQSGAGVFGDTDVDETELRDHVDAAIVSELCEPVRPGDRAVQDSTLIRSSLLRAAGQLTTPTS